MKYNLFGLGLVFLATLAFGQSFQDFINQVNTAPESQRNAMVDSFLTTIAIAPLIEQDSLAHFIYRGNASTVTVPGDANGWNPSAFPMTRVAGTNFWYFTKAFEPDARLDYKLVINGTSWYIDSRNPYTCQGGFGANSELRMPQYVPPAEVVFDPTIAHGSLRDTTFASAKLGNSRTIRVYTPPGYQKSTEYYPVIIFHDGLEYVSLASAHHVIDNLIAAKRIRPIIAVFVPPVNRTAEYAGNQKAAFTAFIVHDLLPYIDSRYRTLNQAQDRAVLGASNGGNISLWLGLQHPELFGNIAAQSSNVQAEIANEFQSKPKMNLRFYLDIGTYDIPILIPLVRNLVTILQAQGYEYQYHEYHEGHSWGNWRSHIDNALELFFPPVSTPVKKTKSGPADFRLNQNYPNPLAPDAIQPFRQRKTRISYGLFKPGQVNLSMYNVAGQKIITLVDQYQNPGDYWVDWYGQDDQGRPQPAGVYFYQLKIDGQIVAYQKLTLIR